MELNKQEYTKMDEIAYSVAELSQLRYVKVTYQGSDNKQHEVKSEVKMLNETQISLYFRSRNRLDIHYPQEVTIKFVTDSGLYTATSTLQDVTRGETFVFLTIVPPAKMSKHQERKYYRVNLKRTCVLIGTNKDGHSMGYMSRMVDVSAGGVLLHKLESMFSNKYVGIEPSDYETYNIVLFLDVDIVLKLSARYVRQEKGVESDRYAFEFIKMKQADIDIISRYLTKEQIDQLKFSQQSGVRI